MSNGRLAMSPDRAEKRRAGRGVMERPASGRESCSSDPSRREARKPSCRDCGRKAPREAFHSRSAEGKAGRPGADRMAKKDSRGVGEAPGLRLCVSPASRFMPDGFAAEALRRLSEALDAVMPLRRAHRADLPDAIRELSAQLTTERYALARSYWSSPRLVSAYLRYFLPWNLLRLHCLFRELELPLPAEGTAPSLLDLGSGPLSVPLALWISRPEWREAPLRVVCVDTSPRPMTLGLQLLEHLAGLMQVPLTWQIHLERAPLTRVLNDVRLRPSLLTGGNVLNEWQAQSQDTSSPFSERVGEVALAVARQLGTDGTALFVEPGTRLGGTLTATLRQAALEEGLQAVAPCPHGGDCPLLGHRDRGWCHVHRELASDAAPAWLTSLTQAARLAKQSLSFSYLQLRAGAPETAQVRTQAGHGLVEARLLSDAFLVPGLGQARYACSSRGLLLVPHAAGLCPGSLVTCRLGSSPRKDGKSGALIAEGVATGR